MRELLLETGKRILDRHAESFAPMGKDEAWSASLWESYEEAGLPSMFGVASSDDARASLADALALVEQAAAYPAPIPLAETLLAGYLLGKAGAIAPAGPVTVALDQSEGMPSLERGGDGYRLTGWVRRVPWARHCSSVLVACATTDGVMLATVDLAKATIRQGANMAGEPRDELRFEHVVPTLLCASAFAAVEVKALGALFRSSQMTGSLARLVAIAIEYVGIREQFGRPLLKFQAVKHLIARLGANQAVAAAALGHAVAVATHDPGSTALPMAKIRIGEAASAGAMIAHQILGAIGYTREHELQAHSRRIWAWRDEFGSEAQWSEVVGRRVCGAGGAGLWPLITGARGMTAGAIQDFDVTPLALGAEDEMLRRDLRAFLDDRCGSLGEGGGATPGFDGDFSREMGRRGWIGSSWPRQYGGRDASANARFVILEEMLAAGAPVLAHMVGERQSGPLLLRFGNEEQRRRFLPRIARGECYFCIGMSEPGAGSDLAALRMRAEKADGGWRLSGSKIWTSLAHLADYVIVLCRTSTAEERHAGTSQLIVDLRTPGVTIAPILNLLDEHEFNQIFFDEVFVPDENVIGTIGAGWRQALSELTNERGGPDRYLSSLPLLRAAVCAASPDPDARSAIVIGRLSAHLVALRTLGQSVAQKLSAGENPALEAALVKEMGASFEQDIAEQLRHLPALTRSAEALALLQEAVLRGPSFSIRGGTREILLGVIADGFVARA